MPRVFGIEELDEALEALHTDPEDQMTSNLAFDIHAALKSAVRAVTPGRQQKTNLEPLMHEAQKAFIRTLRRRANVQRP